MFIHKIIVFLVLQIICIFIIDRYASYLKNIDDSSKKECKDGFNIHLCEVKICMWNLSHMISFFVICLILKPRTYVDHFYIFLLGVSWYFLQVFFANHHIDNEKPLCEHSIVYENMLHPRYDDFVFNTLGQMLYICIFQSRIFKI